MIGTLGFIKSLLISSDPVKYTEENFKPGILPLTKETVPEVYVNEQGKLVITDKAPFVIDVFTETEMKTEESFLPKEFIIEDIKTTQDEWTEDYSIFYSNSLEIVTTTDLKKNPSVSNSGFTYNDMSFSGSDVTMKDRIGECFTGNEMWQPSFYNATGWYSYSCKLTFSGLTPGVTYSFSLQTRIQNKNKIEDTIVVILQEDQQTAFGQVESGYIRGEFIPTSSSYSMYYGIRFNCNATGLGQSASCAITFRGYLYEKEVETHYNEPLYLNLRGTKFEMEGYSEPTQYQIDLNIGHADTYWGTITVAEDGTITDIQKQ